MKLLSCVQLFATPWTVAYQTPQSMEFSRQEYWSGLPFYLRPNYGGGNEDNGDFLQKAPCRHCDTQCPKPCSRPLPTDASTRDSWTLTASLGHSLVRSLLLSPASWFTQASVCAIQESVSPVLCKSWRLYGVVMEASFKSAYAIHRSAVPRAPGPAAVHC